MVFGGSQGFLGKVASILRQALRQAQGDTQDDGKKAKLKSKKAKVSFGKPFDRLRVTLRMTKKREN